MTTQSANQLNAAGATTDGQYEGVGHSLKVVRERRGLALADVSSRLRIRRHYLEAIETGRFAELPGAVYISGFLRQYAEFLGLDAEQVLKTYQAEASDAPQRTVLNFPMPRPEERTPRLWMVVGALVLAGIVYTLWYRHQEALRFGQELIQAVPAHLADLIPASQPIAPAPLPPPQQQTQTQTQTEPSQPAAPSTADAPPAAAADAAPGPATTAAPPASTTPLSTTPAPVTQVPSTQAPSTQALSTQAPSTATPSPAAPPAATDQTQTATAPGSVPPGSVPSATSSPPAPPAPASEASPSPSTAAMAPAGDPAAAPATPASYGVPEGEARIRLEATAPSWIQVRGPNNEQIFTRLLNTGERYLVPNREGLTLLTGNAGGVRVVVDGQVMPSLGASGEVKRGIALDPERLKTAGTERQG